MKKIGVKIWHFLRAQWRRETLLAFIVTILLIGIFSFISKIPIGAAESEHDLIRQSQSVRTIIENPVNAPYKIATLALTTLSPTVRMARAISFTFYIGACVAMFYALKHWHTLQASILTTLAFGANAIMLSTGRLGTPMITVTSFFIFAGMLLWQVHTKSNKLVPFIVMSALGALLYVPGAIWFFIVISLVYSNRIRKLFKDVKRPAILIGVFIALVLLTPLVLGFIRDTNNLKEWLLLPPTLDWSQVPRSILRVPSAFIYRMPVEPLINIGRLPVFDIVSGVLFLIGLNAYLRKLKLDRTRVMIGAALVGIGIGALGQTTVAVIMILPFVYSVVAAGIEYLLDEWYTVFPRNPVARSFGMLL
ncbi:hypothetical protein KC992_03995, partial [Candidatus Saccharibacteria bacterium]|nr:hypothetical protein [Candidatus Saccharibacteria bacterium]